ncbi:MAG: hypothetical protein IKS97_02375 [Fibrobacter sp.]|nr:hypothetical protein [Fibrobacter sp.]
MKKVCKKWMCVYCFLCILGAVFLTACSEVVDADSERILPPDPERTVIHKIYPNDMAKNDSVAVNLARGIMLVVHPHASYQLSFDIDSTMPAPELQLFRTFPIEGETNRVGYTKVRTLSPQIVGNRYVYSFACQENKMSIWFTSLGVDGNYYEGKVKNIHFAGTGTYSDHVSINLIAVGSVKKTEDGVNVEQLSRKMLDMFREKFYGITIDTIYVRYAHEHPTLGSKYPQDKPWVAGESSDDYFVSELAGWPEEGLRNALSIVLVHSIGENDIMGFSHLFPGFLGAGKDGSVVIGENVRRPSGEIEPLSSKSIVMTAVHETGHFFGLRHTSTTRRDLSQVVTLEDGTSAPAGDWSNIEDGLTDTPFCKYVLESGLYRQTADQEVVRSDIFFLNRPKYLAKSKIYECPDLENIMFPVTVDDDMDVSFTKQQMEQVRSSLMIIPH